MHFNDRELATVLAALRLAQRIVPACGWSNLPEWDIATNGGTLAPMRAEEIDALCERINCAPPAGVRPADSPAETEPDTCDWCCGPLTSRIVRGEAIYCSERCKDLASPSVAHGDQGLQVSDEALAEHGPVSASIEAAETSAINHEAYRSAAKRKYEREGEIEIDRNAVVSKGDDPGAYVQAWVWIDDSEAATPADPA